MTLQEYNDVLTFITFFSCLLLCAVYFTEPWWRSYIGWNLFGKTVIIALILLPVILFKMGWITVYTYWVRIYEAIVYTGLPIFILQRTWLLVRAKMRDRKRKERRTEAARAQHKK